MCTIRDCNIVAALNNVNAQSGNGTRSHMIKPLGAVGNFHLLTSSTGIVVDPEHPLGSVLFSHYDGH